MNLQRNLLFILLTCFLIACEGDYSITYRWNGMEVQNADNSTKYPEQSHADSISSGTYCLLLNMDTEELSRRGRYLDSESPPRNMNPLDSLIITSDVDFNSAYPAGVNLTDHFSILNENYFFSLPANGSAGYYISNHHSENYYSEPNVLRIHLLMKKKPDILGARQFKVEFILKDGTTFIDSLSVKLY